MKLPPFLSKPREPLYDEHGLIPTFPHREFDEDGHLIPISEEESRARAEASGRALEAIAKFTDEPDTDTDEIWDEVMRNLGVVPDEETAGP